MVARFAELSEDGLSYLLEEKNENDKTIIDLGSRKIS
jgi:hypothetical protein